MIGTNTVGQLYFKTNKQILKRDQICGFRGQGNWMKMSKTQTSSCKINKYYGRNMQRNYN